MRKLLIVFMFLTSLLHAEYEFGNGVQVGSMPLYLGGYFSANYSNRANEKKYSLEDLAVLAYGNYEKFSYLTEFEFHDLYLQTDTGNSSTIKKDSTLHPERIYVDYEHNENYTLRVGRYNSSVGFWNLLPINVLRPTTSNPKVQDLFPRFTDGLDLTYASYSDNTLKFDLMLQNSNDLDPAYNNYNVNKHYGIGALYENDKYSFKFNSGYFHTLNTLNNSLYYLLLAAKYDNEKYEISSEIGRQEGDNKLSIPYSGYLQGMYHFTPKHSGILRVESYDDRGLNKKDTFSVVGYSYRSAYPVSIKTEYQLHSLSKESQFLFSVSVLF